MTGQGRNQARRSGRPQALALAAADQPQKMRKPMAANAMKKHINAAMIRMRAKGPTNDVGSWRRFLSSSIICVYPVSQDAVATHTLPTRLS